LREELRLRAFENRVLRRIFGPKREDNRSWRKMYDDELHSLYSSPNILRVIKSRWMRWVGHVAHMGEGRGVYRVLIGKPEGKRPLKDLGVSGRVTSRGTGIDGVNWIRLAEDRVRWQAFVNTMMNLRVP
jgi:hypothetical protein